MTSEEALYLLMTNQKKVRDGFTFIDLNTQEKVSIEDCYVIVKKDLEALETLKKYLYYDNKNHCIKMKYIYKRTTSFDYEDLKEWLENENKDTNNI